MNYLDRISYDPETGAMTWAVAGRGIRKGAPVGSVSCHGYRVATIGRRPYRLHRVAWFLSYGEWPVGEIDHINGDPLDNRLANLRVVSRAENSQNRWRAHADSGHGYLGATWNRQHKRWQAKIVANKARHHLGYFDSPQAAHVAYMAAKERLHIAGGCH